jgi:hypothetical protein
MLGGARIGFSASSGAVYGPGLPINMLGSWPQFPLWDLAQLLEVIPDV